MDWNPIHHIEGAAHDLADMGKDVAKTGENLLKDVYDLGKTVVVGSGNVIKDVAHTDASILRDVAHGNFVDAAKDVGKGVGKAAVDASTIVGDATAVTLKGLVDVGNGASRALEDGLQATTDTVSAVNPIAGKALQVADVFAESALNTAILQPVDFLTNLVDKGVQKVTGYELPEMQMHLTPDESGLGAVGKIAQYSGDALGFVAPLIITGGAAAGLDAAEFAGRAGSFAGDAVKGIGKIADAAGDTAAQAGRAARRIGRNFGLPTKSATEAAVSADKSVQPAL